MRGAVEDVTAELGPKAAIKREISAARALISDLLLEMDNIKLQVNPRIEAEYATRIGGIESELLKWQIAARRAKRRCSLAQARANANVDFEPDEFEAQLDDELAEWEGLLAKSVNSFLKAAERLSGSTPLSVADSRELKRLHRQLIKRLHPDLHPSQSEEETRFFKVAQAAYESGNLDILRSVATVTDGMGEEQPNSNLTEDEARAELELVLAHKRIVEKRLKVLKESNPYALKAKLEDSEWVAAYTSTLKGKIEEQKAAVRAYDSRFAELSGVRQAESCKRRLEDASRKDER